jgi:hypothetical protein
MDRTDITGTKRTETDRAAGQKWHRSNRNAWHYNSEMGGTKRTEVSKTSKMLMDSTLGVIFFTRKKRNNPEKMDIYVRITVNKKRAEFSIKRDISVCNWNIFRYRTKETKILFRTCLSVFISFRSSFQLLIDKAIEILITTSIISPNANFRYFPVLPSESKFCLIFLKNLIIVLMVCHDEG